MRKGKAGVVSDTARSLTVLIRCGAYAPDSKLVREAVRFILASQGQKKLWKLSRIELLFPKASAVSYYTNNTTLDALVALSTISAYNYQMRDTLLTGLNWMLESQEGSTGIWYLSSPYDSPNKAMHTWPTAEWVNAVALAAQAYLNSAVRSGHLRPRVKWTRIVLPVAFIMVLLGGAVLHAYWGTLSQEAKNFIVVVIGVALAVNIVSAFMADSIKNWWNNIRNAISGQKD